MAYDGTLKFDTSIDTKSFQSGLNSMSKIAGNAMKATTAVIATASTAIIGIGTAAVKVGMEFEAAMSEVQALSGATGDEFNMLEQAAIDAGASTVFSASEAAAALKYMSLAGWDAEKSAKELGGVLNLAAASGMDLAKASDMVTDYLSAFSNSAISAADFADLLAYAQANSNTSAEQLGEAYKNCAANLNAAGQDVQTVTSLLEAMANQGEKGSTAGTKLRAVMRDLTAQMDNGAVSINGTTVAVQDAEGNFRDLTDILTDVEAATDGMGDAQKAAALQSVFTDEAISGLNLIFNEGMETVAGYEEELRNCSGTAEEMAAVMNDNLKGQITLLGSAMESLGISIYKGLDAPLKEVVKQANEYVGQLQEAFNEGGFSGMVTAVGTVLADIVQKVAEFAPQIIEAALSLISAFCDSIKGAPGLADSVASLITTFVTALFECADEIWTTAIVLVGKLASGIAAGAPQIIEAASICILDIVECIVDWLPDIIDAGVQIVQALADGISGMLPMLMQQTISIITTIATMLVENLPTIIDCAIQIVSALTDGLISALPDLLAGAVQLFQAIVDAVPIIIEKLLQALPNIITSVVDFLVASLPQIIDAAVQMLNGLIEAIPTIVQAITDNLPQIITAIVNGLTTALPQILQAAITLLMAIIQAIPDIVVAIAENLPQIITAIATGLGEAIPQIFTAAKDLLWQIITAIPDIVAGLATAVPDIIAGIVNGLVGGIGAVFDAACELGGGILDGIKSFFGIHSPSTVMQEQGDYLVQGMINGLAALPGQAMQCLSDTLNQIITWGANMMQSMTEIATNAVNSVVQGFSQLAGQVWTHLVNAVTKVTQWGANMLSTASTAASSTINKVTEWFSQLPGKIWTHLVTVLTKVTQWGANMLSAASTAAQNTINKVTEWFSQLPGKVWTHLVTVVSKVTQWGANLLSAASTAAQNAINKVTEWFSQLPGKVWTHLVNTITKVTQFAADLASKASSAAQGFVNNIVNGLSGLPSQMATIGSNIVTGIWNGISSGWSWLTDKVKSLANSLFEAAKDALDINSPSKVFADEVGRWIPPGIGEGFDESYPGLEKQVKGELKGLTRKMQETVNLETGKISVEAKAKAAHKADIESPKPPTTYVEEKFEQTNNYHVPVATPSEVSKANREAARKILKDVK